MYSWLVFVVLLASIGQISGRHIAEAEGGVVERQAQGSQNSQKVIPEWVQKELGNTYSDDAVTTKRPQFGDILGQGLQGILQGIVRAPADIANRVQEIIGGIIRRPGTATSAPIIPIPTLIPSATGRV